MKRRTVLKGAAIALAVVTGPAMAQDESYTIGVAIPSATHGFMGGLNWHAQDSIDRLTAAYPNLEFVLATSGDAGDQVSDKVENFSFQALQMF